MENIDRKNLQNIKEMSDNESKYLNLVAWIEGYVAESEVSIQNLQAEVQKMKVQQGTTYDKLNTNINRLQKVV